MNGAPWAWVLKKTWKIDMTVSRRKSLIDNSAAFGNCTRSNREPVKNFRSGTEWKNRGDHVTTLAKHF